MGVRIPLSRHPLAALTLFTAVMLAGCEPTIERPPFAWNGLRAGMRVSDLESRSDLLRPWRHSSLIAGTLVYDRHTSILIPGFDSASLNVVADTVADVVIELRYAPVVRDTAFEREMETLAASWDKMSGVARKKYGQEPGPYHVEWTTPDGLWSGEIHYRNTGSPGPHRPIELRSKEVRGMDRALARLMQ